MSRSIHMDYDVLRAREAACAARQAPPPRTHTADVITVKPGPNGTIRRTRTIRVQRCCDGCGESIGDATDLELEYAVAGLPLPSVTAEHGCQPAIA